METTITICGWILTGTIALSIGAFAASAVWGAAILGYRLATRFIQERRAWRKIVRNGNYRVAQYAATIMSDTLGYGRSATLGEIINDAQHKIDKP